MNLFTTDKQEYQNTVKRKADEFASTQGSLRLKELWISKTDTGTPREWSDKYSMPILCMIPDGEYQEAKSVFDLLNSRRQNDPAMIDKAIEYLESATSIADLSNEEKRDNAFREKSSRATTCCLIISKKSKSTYGILSVPSLTTG